MIYRHWKQAPWDKDRWPNFEPWEFACRHCGEYYHDPATLDTLQSARTSAGVPFRINSGHRCWRHNAAVGGAPLSMHKKLAIDIAVTNVNKSVILRAMRDAGFTTFGFYGTFLHSDKRKGRRWATNAGRKTWNGLMNF
jgi:hypothetical protein